MQIIPAIDIKDGHCVRLKQGDMQSVTVFSEDPAAMAQHWLEQGAQRLHLVDLNGALAGKPRNELAIREIVSVIGEEIPVQLGGGIRTSIRSNGISTTASATWSSERPR
jgi:phosphoribosylformimino-5-aminoimidazole carboxamide ribotide isomerase